MDPLVERGAIGDVLCATDFTQHARHALLRAAWLPITQGSSLTLLHVLPARLGDSLEARLRAAAGSMMATAEKLLAEEMERSGRAGIERFAQIIAGAPAEIVIERARHARADLVVVGRGERRGAGEHLLGSTAERIVRGSETDVLIVGRPPEGPYRKPLLAVDLSEVSERALDALLRLCAADAPAVRVLMTFDAPYVAMLGEGGLSQKDIDAYVAEQGREAKARLESWLRKAARPGVKLDPILVPGDARREIPLEAQKWNADLIAVGSRRHSRIGGFLLGSVSESIARNATRDVLVVR